MPPKKGKKGKQKKPKLPAILDTTPEHEKLEEGSLEHYKCLLTFAQDQMLRYKDKCYLLEVTLDDLNSKMEQLHSERRTKNEYIKRTMAETASETQDLRDRLRGTEQLMEFDKAKHDRQMTMLRQEMHDQKDALMAENANLSEKLHRLKRFEADRERILAEDKEIRERIERERTEHAEQIETLEKNYIAKVDRMKKDIAERVDELGRIWNAESYRKMGEEFRWVHSDNQRMSEELEMLSKKAMALISDGDKLKAQLEEQKVRNVNSDNVAKRVLALLGSSKQRFATELSECEEKLKQTSVDYENAVAENRDVKFQKDRLNDTLETMKNALEESRALIAEQSAKLTSTQKTLSEDKRIRDSASSTLRKVWFSISSLEQSLSRREQGTQLAVGQLTEDLNDPCAGFIWKTKTGELPEATIERLLALTGDILLDLSKTMSTLQTGNSPNTTSVVKTLSSAENDQGISELLQEWNNCNEQRKKQKAIECEVPATTECPPKLQFGDLYQVLFKTTLSCSELETKVYQAHMRKKWFPDNKLPPVPCPVCPPTPPNQRLRRVYGARLGLEYKTLDDRKCAYLRMKAHRFTQS